MRSVWWTREAMTSANGWPATAVWRVWPVTPLLRPESGFSRHGVDLCRVLLLSCLTWPNHCLAFMYRVTAMYSTALSIVTLAPARLRRLLSYTSRGREAVQKTIGIELSPNCWHDPAEADFVGLYLRNNILCTFAFPEQWILTRSIPHPQRLPQTYTGTVSSLLICPFSRFQ